MLKKMAKKAKTEGLRTSVESFGEVRASKENFKDSS